MEGHPITHHREPSLFDSFEFLALLYLVEVLFAPQIQIFQLELGQRRRKSFSSLSMMIYSLSDTLGAMAHANKPTHPLETFLTKESVPAHPLDTFLTKESTDSSTAVNRSFVDISLSSEKRAP